MDCCSILEEPLPETDVGRLSDQFKALSDPTRLRLFNLIALKGEVCACELVTPLGLSQPTVSHHLKVLHKAGLLERERRGRWIHYQANRSGVAFMRTALA